MALGKFAALLFLICFLSTSVKAMVLVSDEDIDTKNDLIILNEEIDQKLSDKIVLQIHELQSVHKDKPIYMLLDSPGGEVIEGARIIDAMVASKRPIYTVAVGEAASMAAIIHSYGAKKYILPNAILMYHAISSSYSGDIVRMNSRLKMAKMLQDRYIQHIAAHSNTTVAELNTKMMEEWWVNAEEAVDRKLADDMIVSTAFVMTKPKDEKIEEKKEPWFPWFPFPKK